MTTRAFTTASGQVTAHSALAGGASASQAGN